MSANEGTVKKNCISFQQKNQPTIILYGLTGDGKSTLGNTLLERNNAFVESDGLESETSRIKCEEGMFSNISTKIIDTPGLSDSEGAKVDRANFIRITEYIKDHDDIQCFFIVFNYTQIRFTNAHFLMFDSIKRMFVDGPWYQHIALIFTRCESFFPKEHVENKMKTFETNFKKWFHNKIDKDVPDKIIDEIPRICIDSIEARNLGNRSNQALHQLLEWASERKTLKEALGDVHMVELFVLSKEEEETERTISDKIIENERVIVKAKYKRTKMCMVDGSVSYTDWEIIESSRNEKKIKQKAHPISSPKFEKKIEEIPGKIEKVVESEKEIGFKSWLIFGKRKRLIKGRVEQQITIVTSVKTVMDMSDGSKFESDWVVMSKVIERRKINDFEEVR